MTSPHASSPDLPTSHTKPHSSNPKALTVTMSDSSSGRTSPFPRKNKTHSDEKESELPASKKNAKQLLLPKKTTPIRRRFTPHKDESAAKGDHAVEDVPPTVLISDDWLSDEDDASAKTRNDQEDKNGAQTSSKKESEVKSVVTMTPQKSRKRILEQDQTKVNTEEESNAVASSKSKPAPVRKSPTSIVTSVVSSATITRKTLRKSRKRRPGASPSTSQASQSSTTGISTPQRIEASVSQTATTKTVPSVEPKPTDKTSAEKTVAENGKPMPTTITSTNTTSTEPPPPVEDDIPSKSPGEKEWVVERIISSAKIEREPHYLVKWAGWSITASTYEPLSNLAHSPAKIEEFKCIPEGVMKLANIPRDPSKPTQWTVKKIEDKRPISKVISSDGSKYEYLIRTEQLPIKFWEPESYIDQSSESAKKRRSRKRKSGTVLKFAAGKLKEYNKEMEKKVKIESEQSSQSKTQKEREEDEEQNMEDISDADPYANLDIVNVDDFLEEDTDEYEFGSTSKKRKRRKSSSAGPPKKRRAPTKKILDIHHLYQLKIESVQRLGRVDEWIVRFSMLHDDKLLGKVFQSTLGELRHSHPQDVIKLFEDLIGLEESEKKVRSKSNSSSRSNVDDSDSGSTSD